MRAYGSEKNKPRCKRPLRAVLEANGREGGQLALTGESWISEQGKINVRHFTCLEGHLCAPFLPQFSTSVCKCVRTVHKCCRTISEKTFAGI